MSSDSHHSGETDPGLTSLYPESDSLEELERSLRRQARQHELAKITSIEHYKLIKIQSATVQRIDQNLSELVKTIELEKVTKRIEDAQGTNGLKKLMIAVGLATTLITTFGNRAWDYVTHSQPAEEPKAITAEQAKHLEHVDAIGRKEPPPSKEFSRLIDAGP